MSLLAEIRTHSEKKNWYSRQAATKRVQKLTVEYWENIKHIEPDNLVFLEEPGILLGLARTHARSQPGTKVTELMNPARMVNVDCSQSDDAALACALLDRLEHSGTAAKLQAIAVLLNLQSRSNPICSSF